MIIEKMYYFRIKLGIYPDAVKIVITIEMRQWPKMLFFYKLFLYILSCVLMKHADYWDARYFSKPPTDIQKK